MKLLPFVSTLCVSIASAIAADPLTISFEGKSGAGKGKSVVLISGDEEYRSEEGLPQLAKILSEHHGFKTTVLFSINKQTGEIDPNTQDNEPGLEALDSADCCILLTRFRKWPDDQMKHFADYVAAGKPLIGLRTSTHSFNGLKGKYEAWNWTNKTGGFGRLFLGETWVSHWGKHKSEATRGIIEPSAKDDPILRGVSDLFGTTDVYEAHPPTDAKVLVRGQVLKGMKPTDEPADYRKATNTKQEQGVNDPMMAIAWTREVTNPEGKTNKTFCTTMGAATDLTNEGLRRMVVNATYAFTGLEVPAKADVAIVGEYNPSFYGFNEFKKGVKPADLAK